MMLRGQSRVPATTAAAMTLLEIMVAVSLLSLIVLTLYNMFDRTQKALRATRNQTDVSEAGRAGLDVMVREIQQARVMSNPNLYNIYVDQRFAGNSYVVSGNSNVLQTNTLMELFFHNFSPSATPTVWSGIGYRVADPSDPRLIPTNGVGTLYRFSTNAVRATNAFLANYSSIVPASTNYFQRISDGVIHFSVRLYTNGFPLLNPSYPITSFYYTQMVSHVEIELGILPPTLIEQAKASPLAGNQMSFLAGKGDRIQIFRQIVPIQTFPR
jgi:type II secretory pathway pseudopilin PulG